MLKFQLTVLGTNTFNLNNQQKISLINADRFVLFRKFAKLGNGDHDTN